LGCNMQLNSTIKFSYCKKKILECLRISAILRNMSKTKSETEDTRKTDEWIIN